MRQAAVVNPAVPPVNEKFNSRLSQCDNDLQPAEAAAGGQVHKAL
jgi:hypothetical protein